MENVWRPNPHHLRLRIIPNNAEDRARSASKSGRTRIGERSASKRYTVCISPRGGISSTSHERVARDREPVCRNFRKFQDDVAELRLSAGVRLARDTRAELLSFLSFFIYSYLRNEAREPLLPRVSPSIARDTIRSRRIRAYRMDACKNSVIACRVRCTRAQSGSCSLTFA